MPRKKLIAKEKIKEYKNIIFSDKNSIFKYKTKWHTVFGNNNPIHIEIGSGKGKFIVEKADKNPDINYLAIEIKEERTLSAAKKLNNLINLKFLCISINYLENIFDKNEIDKIYINFPDPWPKKRHKKRRMTSKGFIETYQEILSDTGTIELKTDNKLLFFFSLYSFIKNNFDIQTLVLDLKNDSNNIITEFEKKFRQKNIKIYFAKLLKLVKSK